MNFFPQRKVRLVSALSQQEMQMRLYEAVETKTVITFGILYSNTKKPFSGRVSQDGFEIRRIIRRKNSFNPNLNGHFEPYHKGNAVVIDIQLPDFVRVFMILWYAIVSLAFLGTLVGSFQDPSAARFLLAPLGMLTFLYLLSTFSFKYESQRALELLTLMWHAQVEELE